MDIVNSVLASLSLDDFPDPPVLDAYQVNVDFNFKTSLEPKTYPELRTLERNLNLDLIGRRLTLGLCPDSRWKFDTLCHLRKSLKSAIRVKGAFYFLGKPAVIGAGWTCKLCYGSDQGEICYFYENCHAFHKACLVEWNLTNDTCPVCHT